MKSVKLFLGPTLALILLLVMLPIPGQGYVLLPMLVEAYGEAKRNVAALNAKIKMVENLVNQIGDEMDGIKAPSSDARTPSQQVRDLKESIAKELALLKQDMPYLVSAHQKLGLALDSYTKKQSPETLKNAEGYVLLINTYQQKINDRLDRIKNWCAEISKIRRNTDEKEWDKPDGKYKEERDALDNLWNYLMDRPPVPNVVGMKAKEACDLIISFGLKPEIIGLTERPPEGKEYTVKSQDPAPKTQVKPGDQVKIEVYRQVVPNVVGLKLSRAVEVLEQARLKVGGVVVDRAYSQKVSEEVTKQEPQVGESLPENRSVKLWHYDRYGPVTPQPPGGRPQGFQKGDAGRVSPRFGAFPETISPDGNHISIGQSGSIFWFIAKLASREEAQQIIQKTHRTDDPKSNSGENFEYIVKGLIHNHAESLYYFKFRNFTNKFVNNCYLHAIIYRDNFVINYYERNNEFGDELAARWEPVYENSKKLIDERFPPAAPIARLRHPAGPAISGD